MKVKENSISLFESFFSMVSIILFSEAILDLLQNPDSQGDGDTKIDVNEGNLTKQVIFISIYVITMLLIIFKSKNFFKYLRANLWLDLLFILIIVSLSWSDFPLLTLKRIAEIFGSSLFGYYLASRFSLETVLKLLTNSFFIMAVLSVITSVVLPKYGIMKGKHEGNWRGIFLHKNILGGIMCLYVISAFSVFQLTGKKIYLLHIPLALALIALSHSIGSLLVSAVLVIFGYLLKIVKISLQALISILLFFLAIGISTGIYLAFNYDSILKSLGKDPSLSGRTELWNELFHMINKHPLLGYGFGGFWTGDPAKGASATVWRNVGWHAPHAHNGFINVTLDLGYLGLILLLICYLKNFSMYLIECFVKQKTIFIWGILFFTFLLFYNMNESEFLRTNSIYWILFIFTVIYYQKTDKENTVKKYLLVTA